MTRIRCPTSSTNILDDAVEAPSQPAAGPSNPQHLSPTVQALPHVPAHRVCVHLHSTPSSICTDCPSTAHVAVQAENTSRCKFEWRGPCSWQAHALRGGQRGQEKGHRNGQEKRQSQGSKAKTFIAICICRKCMCHSSFQSNPAIDPGVCSLSPR